MSKKAITNEGRQGGPKLKSVPVTINNKGGAGNKNKQQDNAGSQCCK